MWQHQWQTGPASVHGLTRWGFSLLAGHADGPGDRQRPASHKHYIVCLCITTAPTGISILQDMLVDLETAKIELDLARGRADEAGHAADTLRVQLAAEQQHSAALESQLQRSQAQ